MIKNYSYEKHMETLRKSEAGRFDYTGWEIKAEKSGFDENYYNGKVIWKYEGCEDSEYYFTAVTENGKNARIVSIMYKDGKEISFDESFIVQYFILRAF